jgi:hypothetical protein
MAEILQTLRASAAHVAREDEPDQLVPDPQVRKEFGVTSMTLWRWDHDPTLNFPPATKIRGKNYRFRRQLERFKREGLARTIAERESAPSKQRRAAQDATNRPAGQAGAPEPQTP